MISNISVITPLPTRFEPASSAVVQILCGSVVAIH